MRFDGPNFDPALDENRLTKQIGRIYDLMQDEEWRTLTEISEKTGDPPASISAQLRHLRKGRFGGYIITKRRKGEPIQGLWEYQLKQHFNEIEKENL